MAGSNQAAPTFKFDKDKSWQHLLKQVNFGPRVPNTEAHKACGDYLLQELSKVTDKAYVQEFSHTWSQTGKPVKMRNIIGEYNWRYAPVKVLLLAHWDTRPYADQENDPQKAKTPVVGANDGASGVAVLLELMRVLKEAKAPIGVMVLFTDGEDLGPELDEMFLGAKYFAKNTPRPRPDYGILLDMIGDKDLRIPVEPISYRAAPDLIRAFYTNAKNIGLASTFPLEYQTEIADDHLALIDAGIPAIDLIDFTYEPWHTVNDTPDKCSPESLFKVGKALESWLLKSPPWRIPVRR